MIAIDSNVLVYNLSKHSPQHSEVRAWFESQSDILATTSTNFAEALRILSHPRLLEKPFTLIKAYENLRKMIQAYEISILEESADWWKEMEGLLSEIPSLKSNDVFDLRIALCLRYNGVRELFTYDQGFKRFPFLRMVEI